jgi:hypothetical protein
MGKNKRKATCSPVVLENAMTDHMRTPAGHSQGNQAEPVNMVNILSRIEQRLTAIETGLKNLTNFKTDMKTEVKQIRRELDVVKESNLRLDVYTRRDNLLFYNVPENNSVDVENVVRAVLRDKLEIEGNIELEYTFRLGKQRANTDKPRPIMVRFVRYRERMIVLKNAKKLAGTGQAIAPDYPKEMQDRRARIVPIMHQMRRQRVPNCSIREKGTDFVLFADGRPHMTATDLEGDSEEARSLRLQYSTVNGQRTQDDGRARSPGQRDHGDRNADAQPRSSNAYETSGSSGDEEASG